MFGESSDTLLCSCLPLKVQQLALLRDKIQQNTTNGYIRTAEHACRMSGMYTFIFDRPVQKKKNNTQTKKLNVKNSIEQLTKRISRSLQNICEVFTRIMHPEHRVENILKQ